VSQRCELRFEVHENVGVLVEGDLVALRTIITGTHTGDYAGVAPTGSLGTQPRFKKRKQPKKYRCARREVRGQIPPGSRSGPRTRSHPRSPEPDQAGGRARLPGTYPAGGQ